MEELEAIRAIARVRKNDDLAALCAELQVIAAEATGSERSAIYLAEFDKGELAMIATPYGYDGALADRYRRRPLGAPIIGDVVRDLLPRIFSATSLPEPHRLPSIQAGFVEYAIVPLHADGVLTGTLNLARTRAEPYDPDDVKLALAIGDQISVQIERARLYVAEKSRAANLARLNEELRRSHEELARAQSRLVEKERLASLGELAALVAHEVRNPLGVIFNVAAQLRKTLPSEPPGAGELVAILEEEADRLDRIVRAFLEFGRPPSLQPRPTEVRNLVETAIELASRALGSCSVEWVIEVAADASRVNGDAHLLRQAIMSLLMNAAEAQALRGRVSIRARTCSHDGRAHLRLTVDDEGVTPEPAVLARVFEPFFTTKASGTGLGLAIVRRTVEAHAGHVSIQARDGGGTEVALLLPLEPVAGQMELA